MSINYKSFGGKRSSWKDKKRWSKESRRRPPALIVEQEGADTAAAMDLTKSTGRLGSGAFHIRLYMHLVTLLKKTASTLHMTTNTLTIQNGNSEHTVYIGKSKQSADGNATIASEVISEQEKNRQALKMEAELRKSIRGMFHGAPPSAGGG